jgi:hypothetical protein
MSILLLLNDKCFDIPILLGQIRIPKRLLLNFLINYAGQDTLFIF